MSTTTCPPLPDYLSLRKENLAKIQKYYSELLNDYNGLGGNNIDAAQPLISSYNTQLNSAATELINNLNQTQDMVFEQHKNLDDNQKLILANRQRLTQLKKDTKRLTADNDARQKNARDTHSQTTTTRYWHTGFLIANVLLLVIAIILLIWLFISPY